MASKKIRHRNDGVNIGQSTSDKVGFYGVTPVAQRSGAAQVALTDNSGGTASDTIADVPAAYNEANLANSIASLAAKINELRAAMVAVGIIKGSA